MMHTSLLKFGICSCTFVYTTAMLKTISSTLYVFTQSNFHFKYLTNGVAYQNQ